MKNGQDLAVIINTRLTASEAAEWAEYIRLNEVQSSVLLRDLVRRELAHRNFAKIAVRERVAAEKVFELFAETMAISLEGPDLIQFMKIVQRIAPDSEFVQRNGTVSVG
jgi:hypothetical protein